MKKLVYLLGIGYIAMANLALAIPVINDLSVDIRVGSKKGLVKVSAGEQSDIDILASFNIVINQKQYMFRFPKKDSDFKNHISQVTIGGSASTPYADYSGKPGSPDYDNIKGELQ
ncbi:MAG: hypothetical protein ACHQVS_02765 [Candidatus Babeliales bacterium]